MSIYSKLRDALIEDKKSDISPNDYVLMFSGVPGRKVLAHLLMEHHLFDEITDQEEMARRNVLVRMLNRAGILTHDNMPLLARALLEVARLTKEDRDGGIQSRRDINAPEGAVRGLRD